MLRVPVSIVNLSKTGAMVKLPEGFNLPQSLVLQSNHRAEPCETVWYNGNLAGLKFLD